MHVLALTLLWSTLFRTTTASIQLPSQIPGHSPIEMPTLSLGTAGFNSTTVQQVVVDAYQAGFTAVHTAFDYYNVDGVGKGIQELMHSKGIQRSDIFITAMTSPCIHTAANPQRNVSDPQSCTDLTTNETLQMLHSLGVDYVDLLLLHGPSEPFHHTGSCNTAINVLNQAQWKSYTQSLSNGVARSIGVSNFCPSCLS